MTSPSTITTDRARLSYEHLFKAYAHTPGQEEKYSVTVLIPKSDMTTKARIDTAITAAKNAGISKCWNGAVPAVVATPIHDGDGVRVNGEPFGDECKGHWVFTASSKNAPEVVDLNMAAIINPSEVYSGIFARVSVNFFAYNSNGKRGVGCGLNAVQKLSDGEPLGNRISAAEAFGVINPAAATPQQHRVTPQYSQAVVVDPLTGLPY